MTHISTEAQAFDQLKAARLDKAARPMSHVKGYECPPCDDCPICTTGDYPDAAGRWDES
jgi:hypothetical protein